MRAAWEVSRKDAMEANAELLAACKAAWDAIAIERISGPGFEYARCPACAVTAHSRRNLCHKADCLILKLEAAIDKAEGTTQTVVQPPPQQSPQQPPASPPSTIDPKFLTTISPGEFGEDLMP
jgi:hypothetical protein